MPMSLDEMNALVEEVDDHYQEVSDAAEANFAHREFRDYPADVTRDYRRDSAKMDKLYGRFHDFVEKIDAEGMSEKREAQFMALLDALYTSVETTQASNAMFKAFLDEGVAGKAAGMLELIALLIKGQRATVDDLIDEVERIEKLLVKAKKESTEVQIQKAFNLAVTAATLCIPQLRGIRAVLAALGIAGGKIMVDEFLGPSGPTTAAGIKTSVFDYLGIAEEVGKIGNTVATIYSTVDTYVTDETELGKAEKTVRDLRKQLEATQKSLAAFRRLVEGSEKDLAALGIGLHKAVTAAHKARASYAAEAKERAGLIADAA